MKSILLSGCMAFLMGSFIMAEETPKVLFDFTGADAAKEWQTINDGVMGGVSEGKFKITDKKTLEFYGTPKYSGQVVDAKRKRAFLLEKFIDPNE